MPKDAQEPEKLFGKLSLKVGRALDFKGYGRLEIACVDKMSKRITVVFLPEKPKTKK